MNKLSIYIQEKLKINSKTKVNKYYCKPKNKHELKKIIQECLKKDKDADLNDIDVSEITDMSNLFGNLDPHNIDISNWDVSNVENMGCMFYDCENFNSDLSSWNVSNVTSMIGMFWNCKNFNCDLSNWDVHNVENMSSMFTGCESLKNEPSWY